MSAVKWEGVHLITGHETVLQVGQERNVNQETVDQLRGKRADMLIMSTGTDSTDNGLKDIFKLCTVDIVSIHLK